MDNRSGGFPLTFWNPPTRPAKDGPPSRQAGSRPGLQAPDSCENLCGKRNPARAGGVATGLGSPGRRYRDNANVRTRFGGCAATSEGCCRSGATRFRWPTIAKAPRGGKAVSGSPWRLAGRGLRLSSEVLARRLGCGRMPSRGHQHQAHFSTQEAIPPARPRIPAPHEHRRRCAADPRAPAQGSPAAHPALSRHRRPGRVRE